RAGRLPATVSKPRQHRFARPSRPLAAAGDDPPLHRSAPAQAPASGADRRGGASLHPIRRSDPRPRVAPARGHTSRIATARGHPPLSGRPRAGRDQSHRRHATEHGQKPSPPRASLAAPNAGGIMNFEDELKLALRRKEPPPGFRQRVLAATRRPRHAYRSLAAAALLTLLLGGTTAHFIEERREGERAKEQVLLAL